MLGRMIEGQRRELQGRSRRVRRMVVQGRSAVYHVMSRMVRRRFWMGEEEREVFVAMLRRQAAFTGVEVLTYCVMGNHFHLLIRVPECPLRENGEHLIGDVELLRRYEDFYGERLPLSAWSVAELREILEGEDEKLAEAERRRVLARMGSLPEFVRELKHRFSVWFNHRHENSGTIWSARFKSLLVEDTAEVLTKVGAYIDLNPVRAELAKDPADYRWCGYAAAMAGVAEARSGLQCLYGADAGPGYRDAVAGYRLVLFGKGSGAKGVEGKDLGRIDAEALGKVIEAGGEVSLAEALRCRWRYFSDGTVLGGRDFVEACFQENREFFGPRRKRGGAPMKGSCWGGLHAARRLVKQVLG